MAKNIKNSIFHENYGMFWMHQGVLETVQNVWHYTFAVEISTPEIPEIELPCETPYQERHSRSFKQRRNRNRKYRSQNIRNGGAEEANTTEGITSIRSTTSAPPEPTPQSAQTAYEFQNALKNFCPTLHAYKKRHDYLLQAIVRAENEINSILPEPMPLNCTKRGLFNIIGEVSKSLFGTATESDIKVLAQHIQQIASNDNVIRNQVNVLQNSLTSYMRKDNDRAELIRDANVINQKAINLTRYQFYSSLLQVEEYMIDWFNFVHVSGVHYTSSLSDILREIQIITTRIHTLIQGFLPVELISPTQLELVLSNIKSELSHFGSFCLTHESPMHYYHIPDLTYSRQKDMYVKIKFL